ncbi:EAL domain-containing protein [Williamsia sp. CHRR-6]|uniref:EAL domain-containing protein n=1 Tax=Williamsia sp. CHRR-6 TaxID=2835871 RepID=UPI001BDB419F|nr:EAL domain-containing protein [Williamsia sp. CHRR-6]MBT0565966.1 EAL domain-containing protein [Williamsia sp. CHRR-6]
MQSSRDFAQRAFEAEMVPAFQPIVDLQTRTVVGYESLARWPSEPTASPPEVFDHAESLGKMGDLDTVCRHTSMRVAIGHGMRCPHTLFLNLEPRRLDTTESTEFPVSRVRAEMGGVLDVVHELTERDLLTDPAAVLRAVAWSRRFRFGVALDDVGVTPGSLAMLHLVSPDIVKLDRRLVHGYEHSGVTINAVLDYASESGASIVAEGIETEDDLAAARITGATLGQGYLFGRPGPLPDPMPVADPDLAIRLISVDDPPILDSPAEIIERLPSHVTDHETIMRVADTLADRSGGGYSTPGCMVTAVQYPEVFAQRFARFYPAFAAKHTIVGVVGAGDVQIAGVRTAADPREGFTGQLAMAILNQNYASALVAVDLGDSGPLAQRRYRWVYTHQRAAVREVARSIVARLAPLAGTDGD